VEKSYRAGIELDAAYILSKKFTLGGNMALSQNKIAEFTEYIDDYSSDDFRQESNMYQNTDIAFSPNIVSSAILEYQPIKNLSVNWLSKYVGRQFLDNTSNVSRSLNAFLTHDLRISYQVQPRYFKSLEFNLLVNNLFNEMYEPNGYTFSYFVPGEASNRELVTENYFYPMAGINFLMGVSFKF
jgi:iron complex outermembrane receptor protein